MRSVELPEHPGYRIFEDGSVIGPRGFALNLMRRPSGYLFIRRWDGAKHINLSVHGLVCTAFRGPRPSPTHQVRHLNGDKADNRACNLTWGTPKQNQRDRVLHGTSPRGEGNGQAKVTWEMVGRIRALHASGTPTLVLMQSFGLSRSQIYRIIHWESWRNPPASQTEDGSQSRTSAS